MLNCLFFYTNLKLSLSVKMVGCYLQPDCEDQFKKFLKHQNSIGMIQLQIILYSCQTIACGIVHSKVLKMDEDENTVISLYCVQHI